MKDTEEYLQTVMSDQKLYPESGAVFLLHVKLV